MIHNQKCVSLRSTLILVLRKSLLRIFDIQNYQNRGFSFWWRHTLLYCRGAIIKPKHEAYSMLNLKRILLNGEILRIGSSDFLKLVELDRLIDQTFEKLFGVDFSWENFQKICNPISS